MRNIITTLLVLLSLHAFTQNDAKSILDKVSEKTQSYKSITATFDFIMKNDEAELNETSNGDIIIQDSKYKLTFNGVEIYNDGQNCWTFMEDAEEVTISDAEEGEEGILNPANIFTIYQNGYENKLLSEEEINGKKVYKIQLTPTEEKDFSKVILIVEKATNQIISAEMYEIGGNIYNVTLTGFDTSKTYPETTFKFDESKHSDIEVVDMR